MGVTTIHGPNGNRHRVRRKRLEQYFRNAAAADLQDKLWKRWGARIPVLVDREPKVPPTLLAQLLSPSSELSDLLLGQLLAHHPADGVASEDGDGPLFGSYLADVFHPRWKNGTLPGKPGRPKTEKTARERQRGLYKIVYEFEHDVDEHGVPLYDTNGKPIGSWGVNAAAWTPFKDVTPATILALDEKVRKEGIGLEVWRQVRSYLLQAFNNAILRGDYPRERGNPVAAVPAPPQAGVRQVTGYYTPLLVELIRADFRWLDAAASTRVRGQKVDSSPGGVPVPEVPGYGEFGADFTEALGYSGARPGEILGSAAEDLDGNYLRVERRNRDGELVDGTKSEGYPTKSVLLLGPLPASLRRRAKAAMKRPAYELTDGRKVHLLFPFPGTNRPFTEEEYRRFRSRYFQPIAHARLLELVEKQQLRISSAEIDDSKDPYSLRHVYASLRIAAGHATEHINASMGTTLVGKVYGTVIREYEGRTINIAVEIDRARRQAARMRK